MSTNGDVQMIRELARQYRDIAARPVQDERRELWRRHNSLVRTRPLIYMRWFACQHEVPECQPQCEDPFWRGHERFLRFWIFHETLGDDTVVEPWITQRASLVTPPNGPWGVAFGRIPSTEPGGAWKFDPPLKDYEDIEKLVEPHHVIDEEATARNVERLQDAVGDILEVNVDRAPAYQVWSADVSTHLAYLRGIGQAMWDMVTAPEWLHRLCSFMGRCVLRVHDEAEAAGDWRLCNHQNQSIPYAQDLDAPAANSGPVTRDKLWCFFAAQEMAQVSPAMHDEFILQYQLPMIRKFGLCAYGCCEDLTHKIDMLRQIPNLRRIAVVPRADVPKSAEQIGDEYVCSWRPNPSEMICCGYDPDLIRRIVTDAMDAFAAHGCHVDITLKDVQTIGHQPANLRRWVELVRSISDRYV